MAATVPAAIHTRRRLSILRPWDQLGLGLGLGLAWLGRILGMARLLLRWRCYYPGRATIILDAATTIRAGATITERSARHRAAEP